MYEEVLRGCVGVDEVGVWMRWVRDVWVCEEGWRAVLGVQRGSEG